MCLRLFQILVDSASHLSRGEKADAISEITGIDPKSASLNEVTSNVFMIIYKVHLCCMYFVETSLKIF